ncbi:MAG TPA: hypothetical protein VEA92_01825 [Candidatus Paceibacterota bacterium]|nr:hypothetical protein [Candidatus Paceibacterota bacterium]
MSSGEHGGGGLPGLHAIEHWMHSGHETGGLHLEARPIIIAFVVMTVVFLFMSPAQTLRNFSFLLFFAPLWLPIILWKWTFFQYLTANRAAYIARQKHVLLELRLPRDTMKTPAAMESVFSALHLGLGEATWWKRIVLGQVRAWYSFEIVSLGGQVHFYVWTRDGFRRAIESAFYAQYPGAEIIEVEDYSRLIDPSHEPNQMVGFEYLKSKPLPLPIRTYVEFGLDKPQKPEEQIDPLAQLIELLGSLGPHEQLWVQITIRTHKGETYNKKKPDGKDYTWKDAALEQIAKLRKEAVGETEQVDPVSGRTIKVRAFPNPTKGQTETIAAYERNSGKLAFDTGIRALYTAPKEHYQGIVGGFLVNLWKPFVSEGWNSLNVMPDWSNKYMEYPWEDPHGHHQAHTMHLMVDAWRRRQFFHSPYKAKWNVMSTEELATLFHVPSATVATPSLPRIQSTTSGAPSNLPV